MVRIVGSVLVRNEDVFVEKAIRNVVEACDRIHVLDHLSTDRTPDILAALVEEFDHIEVCRSHDSADSHRQLEGYVGTPTWVLGVDGDELYDRTALAALRADLLEGAHGDVFGLKGHVLNCDELDEVGGTASGFLSPPSRPVTKLFNMAAVSSWRGCPERLHAGSPEFQAGFEWTSIRYLSDDENWESDPSRLLHPCFVRRSSGDDADTPRARRSLGETGAYRRGVLGTVGRLRYRRRVDPRIREYEQMGSSWKDEWYRRGGRVTVDARPFLGQRVARRGVELVE